MVAEQQLPIPCSWLKLPPSAPASQPEPTAGDLTLAHKSHDGVKHISVSGPAGLHVEVSLAWSKSRLRYWGQGC